MAGLHAVQTMTQTRSTSIDDQLMEALCRRQRLDLIGEITGGMAHDLNNALGVVSGYTELLLEKVAGSPDEPARSSSPSPELLEKDARTVLNWTTTAMAAASRLVGFSRRLREKHGPHSLNELAEEAVSLMRYRCEADQIILAQDLCSADPRVAAEGGMLVQAVVNLIQNSREAITAQGRVGGTISVSTYLKGTCAFVEVEDDGPGIPDKVGEGVMDAGYTTKEDPSGQGLGLTITRWVAQRYGGDLRLGGSEAGACLVLELPTAS